MSEKRFVPSKYAGHTHDVKTDKHYYVTDEYVGCRELFDEIENLEKENEQLKKKIKSSIYNKKDGDWKWNVDNNTILNIRTGEIFYLRNSGAVENLVHLLNKLEQILSAHENVISEFGRENEQLKKQLELRTESDKYHQRMLLKWLCIDEDEK